MKKDRNRWERKGERGRKREDVREWIEGGKERQSWRGERGKNFSCTRCIDFRVEGDF